jgi:hypothetical protein
VLVFIITLVLSAAGFLVYSKLSKPQEEKSKGSEQNGSQ